ncbi:aldo/keto reductase [Weizmannia coagulans]|uniref:Aldo/keto reductase n=3 Tax=Heyndrickxia TaxID=2837504 RepID=A0A0C5C1E4_HEYCO|nr:MULTISPECIES: aldo/keto reductase [Heyndrickxia]AEP01503.1 aldo/keto reductase [Heyndrickxia coagulans 36D1]AJO22043.1 aldo/keto reductase [Heyndrickxia coagulans]AKN56410.1 oxidoreductase of aldo/keto reductase family, subgroup 1 [Heyndrickxia coagulans]ATW82461.1 aldo/keto reductase [Heyndrickxia coagulans]AVD56894.1 aldo/keto reductase [Heyndrickxia coagulans]
MAQTIPNLKFNNGVEIPQLGLGVFLVKEENELKNAVKAALETGYRHIDTAMIYGNETYVGEAIRESGVDRKEIFITSKVWNYDHGYEETKAAFQASLDRLGTDYLDLYLIHWPSPKYIETWKAMEELYHEGKIKAIGVSNFQIHHLEDLLAHSEVVPVINQIETHPEFPQNELHEFLKQHNILHEAWGPLGQGKNNLLEQPVLVELGKKYGKTPAQIVLRWHVERGIVVIPKSVTPSRIKENSEIFDFSLTPEDMEKIASLNTGKRYGRNPDDEEFLAQTSVRPE